MSKLISGIVAAVVAGFFLWWGLWYWVIPFNFNSFGAAMYYGWLVFALPISILFVGFIGDIDGDGFFFGLIPTGILLLIMIIGGCSGMALFQAGAYATQLSVPESVAFAENDIPAFDPTEVPWVDEGYAQVLGDKPLGTLGAIGSSVEIGEYVRQEVNGDLFFVAPILHKDGWKYSSNPAGTPGFVMVSMTNDDDVRLVTDHPIRIQPHGHARWGDKLERIVQSVAPNALRYEIKFEIDDEMRPHWVVPLYENKIGFWGGKEINGVVTVNATTGEAYRYKIEDAPHWVDRIYPVTLVEGQLANWGQYSSGWWNTSWFGGKTGMLQSDAGNSLVYADGECFVFDSLTSFGGSDESTVGFVLINLRTKEVRRFDLAGATEWAAVISALGDERVKAQNYSAAFPLPTVIEGQPTYFMPLVDPSSHTVKSYAFVSIAKHQIVGIGDSPRAAEMDYRTKLRGTGQTSIYTPSADMLEVTSTIVRWGQYAQSGNTYYTFVVEGHEDKLFVTDASMFEAIITQQGDRVKLLVMKTDNSSWSVFSFDNLEFTQALGEIEQIVTEAEMEQKLQEVADDPAIMSDEKFQEFWNSLTPEQQEVFLEQAA